MSSTEMTLEGSRCHRLKRFLSAPNAGHTPAVQLPPAPAAQRFEQHPAPGWQP
jgi:hypothetical protein